MKNLQKIADPFNYWSGEKTLAAGAIGGIVMAAINRLGGQTTRGVVSSGYADLTFLQALCQILAAWLLLATLLYIAARLLSKSRIRAVDLYGNQLLARIVLLPILLVGALPSLRNTAL